MGHTMFHLPVPSFMNNVLILAILQMLLTICIMILNQKFFINGIKGILNYSMNMDTLVSIGVLASLIYSIFNTIRYDSIILCSFRNIQTIPRLS